jgi:hypothetical protein
MSALRDTQAAFHAALLGDEPAAAIRDISGDGLAPEARLAIYRHHVAETLGDLLQAVYPVVCRLVDARFFAYAADRFIAAHPPTSPCLFEYGEAFADFLAYFEPCRALTYLPDVARLEWALNRAEHADDAATLDVRLLGEVPAEDFDRLTFRLHPSVTLLRSPWPIDRIWRASQLDAGPDTTVDVQSASASLQVWRRNEDVLLRPLASADFAFRLALADGRTLGTSAEIASAADPGFDLAASLSGLFHDDVLTAFTLDKEDRS